MTTEWSQHEWVEPVEYYCVDDVHMARAPYQRTTKIFQWTIDAGYDLNRFFEWSEEGNDRRYTVG